MEDIYKDGMVSNFKDRFDLIMETKGKAEAKLLAVIIWLIWKRRNEILFGGKVRETKPISNYGISLLQEFQNKQWKTSLRQDKVDQKWRAPDEDFLKIDVDGAFTKDGVGVGIVIRNSKGEVEAVMIGNIPHSLAAEHVQTLSMQKALVFAQDFGISHFVLKRRCIGSDSEDQ